MPYMNIKIIHTIIIIAMLSQISNNKVFQKNSIVFFIYSVKIFDSD